MMDKPIENFHYCPSQSAMVETIHRLLEQMPKPKRVRYYSMDYVCQEIYKLFYRE